MRLNAKVPAGPLQAKWDRHRFELKLVNPANKRKFEIIVVGTGLAGASASATLALADQGYGIEQLLGALDDFHYDALEIRVDGDTRGEVEVVIHLGGFNPNFQRGRRVELNLNVEARLADLVRAGLFAYRVPEVILKKLEGFQAPEVP